LSADSGRAGLPSTQRDFLRGSTDSRRSAFSAFVLSFLVFRAAAFLAVLHRALSLPVPCGLACFTGQFYRPVNLRPPPLANLSTPYVLEHAPDDVLKNVRRAQVRESGGCHPTSRQSNTVAKVAVWCIPIRAYIARAAVL